MEAVFTKSNLIKAGATTVAIMLAMKLTSSQSKLIQGAAAALAAAVAIPLSAKIG